MAQTETDKGDRTARSTSIFHAGDDDQSNGMASTAATVAIIGLGVALIEVELIPGMLIGIAAVLAPNFLPRLGKAIRPLVKGAVRAGYALAEKTRETVAEAGEQFEDIVAEVKSETATTSGSDAPVRKTSRSKR